VLQRLGRITDQEMYRTFNMGMGFGIVLRPEGVEEALSLLKGKAQLVGRVVKGSGCGIPGLRVHYDTY